jgi:hypothetical protein
MNLYLDGNLLPTVLASPQHSLKDVYYPTRGQDFWVGKHGETSTDFDFQGNIDEVRVYNRVLSAAEIQALAQGVQLPPL